MIRVLSDMIKKLLLYNNHGWKKPPPPLSRPMDNRNRYPPGTSTLLRIQQMEQVNEERGGGEGSEVGTEGGRETDGVCSIMKERPLRSKKPTGVITKSRAKAPCV